MNEIEIGVIASVILLITQAITQNWVKLNKMWVTLIVTAVVGTVAYFVRDSIGLITVLLALAVEVTGYDIITKAIIRPLSK